MSLKATAAFFLDANENPYGNLNRYPDPYQKELKTAISEFKGIAGGEYLSWKRKR